jgi:N-acetylglucosamine kinase-like BadF-type ATPase
MDHSRLSEVTPLLFAVADLGDPVAVRLVERLAEEISVLAVVALRRLDLLERPADVVLGGGVLAARNPGLLDGIKERLAAAAPHARPVLVDAPPVLGAALLGLDAIGASRGADDRLRSSLASILGNGNPG